MYPNMEYSEDVRTVVLSRRCRKSLGRTPRLVVSALAFWKREIEENGIGLVQKVPTYRDHGLAGKLKKSGIRSVSLSYGYRAYYRLLREGTVQVVLVEDVNNHDYKKIERLFS